MLGSNRNSLHVRCVIRAYVRTNISWAIATKRLMNMTWIRLIISPAIHESAILDRYCLRIEKILRKCAN